MKRWWLRILLFVLPTTPAFPAGYDFVPYMNAKVVVYHAPLDLLEQAVLTSINRLEDILVEHTKGAAWVRNEKFFFRKQLGDYEVKLLRLRWLPVRSKMLEAFAANRDHYWLEDEPRESTVYITIGARKDGRGGSFLLMDRGWVVHGPPRVPKSNNVKIPLFKLDYPMGSPLLKSDLAFLESVGAGQRFKVFDQVLVISKPVLDYLDSLAADGK